jgi:crossover junction endodeoxyribonuclease RuvC
MLLTLDLATVLGFTIGEVADRHFKSGYFRLPSTGDDIGRFAAAYHSWLKCQLDGGLVTEVVFEAPILPRHTSLATIRKLSGLAWHTEFLCTSTGIACYEAHLQSVKKAIGGHGRAAKGDMIAAVRRYGYDVTEENEADAIAVRLYTLLTRYPRYARDFGLELGLLGAT